MHDLGHPMLSFFGLGTENFSGSASLWHPLEKSRRCQTCNRNVSIPNFEQNILTVRKIGPDEFFEGSEAIPPTDRWPPAFGPHVLRSDVFAILIEEGVTGVVPRELTITIEDYDELPQTPPDYVFLEIAGRFDVRILHEDVRICPECRSRTDRVFRDLVYLPVIDSWDGSDLCEIANVTTRGTYCSRRFIDMAVRRRLDFFQFGHHIPHVQVRQREVPDWYEDVYVRTKSKYPHLFAGSPTNERL